MNKEKKLLVFISVMLFLTLVSQVSAAEGNFLNDMLDPFKDVDVAETYDRYQPFIDAFLYFIFFISVVKVTLAKRFSGPGGNALIVSIGLILAISMSWWASSVGFTFKSFGVVTAAIFIGIIWYFIFAFIRHQGGNVAAASALGYVIAFLLAIAIMPQLADQLRNGPKSLRTLWGLLNVIFLFALIMAIMGISRWFRGEWVSGGTGGGGRGGGRTGGGYFGPESRAQRKTERDAKKKEQKSAEALQRAENVTRKLQIMDDGIRKEVTGQEEAYLQKIESDYKEHINFLEWMKKFLLNSWQVQESIEKYFQHRKTYATAHDQAVVNQVLEAATRFDSFVNRIVNLLQRLEESLKQHEKYDDKIGEFEKKQSKSEKNKLKWVSKAAHDMDSAFKNQKTIVDEVAELGGLKKEDLDLNRIQKSTKTLLPEFAKLIKLYKAIHKLEVGVYGIHKECAKNFRWLKGKDKSHIKVIGQDIGYLSKRSLVDIVKRMLLGSIRNLISLRSYGDVRQVYAHAEQIRAQTLEKIKLVESCEQKARVEVQMFALKQNMESEISALEETLRRRIRKYRKRT